MRHIHVELVRKDAAQTQTNPDAGLQRVGSRPFSQEELRVHKAYQLAILSRRGGAAEGRGPQRAAVKRGPDDTLSPVALKRPLQDDEDEDEDEEEEDEEEQQQQRGRGDEDCRSGTDLPSSCLPAEHRDPEVLRSPPRSPPLSPTHSTGPGGPAGRAPAPRRRPAQHGHDHPILDAFAPLSPKSPPMVDPQAPHSPWGRCEGSPPASQTGASVVGDEPPCSGAGKRDEHGGGMGISVEVVGTSCTAEPLEHLHLLCPPLTPDEAAELGAGLETSPPPPDRKSQTPGASWSCGLSALEKSLLEGRGMASTLPTPCAVRKKLLTSSEAGESCSEDEGPSTSKRSRLALLTPGLGLAAGRSTDSKAAPYWTHLLPAAREQGKSSVEGSRSSRRLKSDSRLKSRQLRSGRRTHVSTSNLRSSLASISRALLGNFEESILKGRFSPSGRIEGFTAEIGASGSYCPQHATLPVQVTYYDTAEHSAPSPFLGVISLDPLGKKGYNVPKAGTIQVTLFNPNKTVVKMFLVTYNFGDMPVNHMTFLRHRIFLVPVEEVEGLGEGPGSPTPDRKKILCYLMHLRFQSSKSGKIYLHSEIRLLFSRRSIEVDTGIPYELKSFTEVPRNPKYSPRV
ncbi:protein FAM214B [Electrophorus electricus]|uniref:Atos homolog protein B n=1 Tax=Electrophorus electricus TaxID=8005 RepID=A0AAY5EAR3_ELEEL|nr:protein FAM214B [Electrophorus electricus]XP_035382093.1 protein FAM214B [Electrophorus electricus]XP_035382094.1 protein FAM214B [Electrophorus electricus]XP_035382095.1 protein FAM214B [Electrophorus electricus]XP_035382096.1 protein FAM214B [Electrophorus electricus]XP_035382097.1 protein FAM214B [Electrophorus electricus]XP_035382099.1 protein FAM214B [Electrophorus electricus]XP_035382100.1 protein FAM214B [Electrophorus electricus]